MFIDLNAEKTSPSNCHPWHGLRVRKEKEKKKKKKKKEKEKEKEKENKTGQHIVRIYIGESSVKLRLPSPSKSAIAWANRDPGLDLINLSLQSTVNCTL